MLMNKILSKIRFIFGISFLISSVFVYFAIFSLMKLVNIRSFKLKHYLIKIFAHSVLIICGIKINIHDKSGVIKAKTDDYFIFAVNHTSFFDHIITFRVIPVFFRVVALDMIYNFPIFGFIIKEIGGLKAVRSFSKVELDENIDYITAALKEASILIYPEGRFSKDGKLLEFRRGMGEIAKKSGKAVVPVIIQAANKLLPPPPYKVVGKGIWFFSYALFWIGHMILGYEPREVNVYLGEATKIQADESIEAFSLKIRGQFLAVLGE